MDGKLYKNRRKQKLNLVLDSIIHSTNELVVIVNEKGIIE